MDECREAGSRVETIQSLLKCAVKLSSHYAFQLEIIFMKINAKGTGFHEQADVPIVLSQASPTVYTTRPRYHYSRVFIPRTNAMSTSGGAAIVYFYGMSKTNHVIASRLDSTRARGSVGRCA